MSEQQLRLDNGCVSVSLIPSMGGKLTSIRDVQTGFEYLFQNPKGEYRPAALYDHFADYDASGFDDAFPNIDETNSMVGDRLVHFPDHGEIWTTPMDAAVDGEGITLSCHGRVLQYAYEKRAALEGRSVCLCYRIRNTGTEPMPFLWTMHCLFRCAPGDRLILPSTLDSAENVLPGTDLGRVGRVIPLDDPAAKLTAIPAPGPNVMRKFYLNGTVKEGVCGIEYPSAGMRVMTRYDAEVLPYLGFWCTMGGFRGDCNAALEPSSGCYDSIDTARSRNALPIMLPGEEKRFAVRIVFELLDARDTREAN